jgi:hypothetical protein
VTAFWVCVHPISKETAEQLLASGVVSHREELIQCTRIVESWKAVRMLSAHHERGWPLQGARGRDGAGRLTRTPTKMDGLGSNLNRPSSGVTTSHLTCFLTV